MANRESFALFGMKVKETVREASGATAVSMRDEDLRIRVFTEQELSEEQKAAIYRKLGERVLEFVTSGRFKALDGPKEIRADIPRDDSTGIERVVIRK